MQAEKGGDTNMNRVNVENGDASVHLVSSNIWSPKGVGVFLFTSNSSSIPIDGFSKAHSK